MLVPLGLVALGAPVPIQSIPSPYDGGLLLTLARFSGLSQVPYRDLWTLYGPGPPYYGAAIMELFGPGLLPIRLGYLVLHALLVTGVFVVAARFVRRWVAALLTIPIATFAYSPAHFHFAGSIALILWGTWFLLRAPEDPAHTPRRVTIGALLIGTSFWGRYEFVVIAVVLVVVLWLLLRRHLGTSARWMLLAGLTPPALFTVYLVAVVGWDRAYHNLVEFPFRLYPRPYCRGLPDAWGPALNAFLMPFRGRIWSGYDLTLALGTYLVPVVGGLVLVKGVRRGRERPFERAVILALGIAILFVWLEMRPRASTEPHPTWPLTIVGAAVLLEGVRSRGRRIVALAVPGAVFLLVMATSWLPNVLPSWTTWPAYDPLYGFSRIEEDWVFDRRVWNEMIQTVHRYAAPDEPIFVGLQANTGHFANFPIFYWVTDRPPVSRFIEFEPCFTDTESGQRLIVQDLEGTDVIVNTAHFPWPPPPFGAPATTLDAYMDENFMVAYTGTLLLEGDIEVLVRRGASPVGGVAAGAGSTQPWSSESG